MLRSENSIDFDIENDIDPSGVVKQPDLLRVFRVHALVDEAAGRCGYAELAINAPFARPPIPDQRLSLLQCRKEPFRIVGSSIIGQL